MAVFGREAGAVDVSGRLAAACATRRVEFSATEPSYLADEAKE